MTAEMRGARRWVARSHPLTYLPLFFVVGVLLVGTASASSLLVWRAPYSGSLHSVHHTQAGTCGSPVFGSWHLDRTNGHLSGGASASSTAACNHNSSSLADVDASVGLTLPTFTGRSGNYTVLVHWKLDFKVDLTVSGSNCQSGTYAVVSIGFGMILDNVSNGSAAGSDGHAFLFKLTHIGSATHLISQNVTVKLDIALDPSVSYEVVPGASFSMGTDAPSPAPPATSTCYSSAILKGGSPSGIAVLVSAAVL